MTLQRLATRTVTYHRHTTSGEDDYGNPLDVWVADADTTKVYLEQTGGSEINADESTQHGEWLLVDPNPAAGITGRDKVEIDGDMFTIDGPPWIAHTPRGPHHVEARLRYIDPK